MEEFFLTSGCGYRRTEAWWKKPCEGAWLFCIESMVLKFQILEHQKRRQQLDNVW
jgi:predicted acetyltransferase